MHRATDDVPTIARLSGTRQCCVLYVIFTMAAVCVVVASTDVTTNPQNGGATGNAFVYDDYRSNSTLQLDIIFICDGTAREYCSADVMMSEINKHFPPPDDLFFSDEDSSFNISDCDVNPQSQCHNFFSNTKNTTSPPNGVRYSLVNNSIVATKLLKSDSSSSFFLKLNVTFHVLTGDYPDLLVEINTLAVTASADVIIAVGGAVTLQSSAFVGDALDIPTIGYITNFKDGIKNIYGRTFTSLNPSPEAQGTALAQVIGSFNMKQTTVMVEDTRLADGFLSGVRKVVGDRNQDVFRILPLQRDIRKAELLAKLTDLSTKGWKVILLHCSPPLMLKVVTSALSTRLYNAGHAWFLSEMAFSRDRDIVSKLPGGLLAIQNFWLGGLPGVMIQAVDYVMSATTCFLRKDNSSSNNTFDNVPYFHDGEDFLCPEDEKHNCTKSRRLDRLVKFSHVRRKDDLFPETFQQCLNKLLSADSPVPFPNTNNETNSTSVTDTDSHFAYDPHRKNILPEHYAGAAERGSGWGEGAFYLLNTVDDGRGHRIWSKVGYITCSGERDLKTVLWPGHDIYGPASHSVKTYRVATWPVEPFVLITEEATAREDCYDYVPCLKILNSSSTFMYMSTIVEDFQTDMKYLGQLYTLHCCKGLAIELLDALSRDLNFRYVVYFQNETDFGTPEDGIWTGMVGDIISGTADIVAGAFSMTSERMNVIDFTEPFYQNEFAVVTGQDGNYVSMWAFSSPFSGQVWLCISLSSIVAGIATSFLEWHSPFGLNPKGRKRTKNYGLGSGLLMVVVLMTGHTINIKAPKSWPGKVIQNLWAAMAIFIMSSYTANLAAYLAGQSAVVSVKNVFDSELLTKRVAVIQSSAVESFLEKINPKLAARAELNYVESTTQAVNMLRDGQIDVYLDDTPLLEFALASYDKDCKVRFAGKGFGSDGYAFGVARHSWLRIPMSNKILWYRESGLIQELAKKYLSRPQCEHFLAGTANPYGLEHTGGLFIILLSAVFMSVLLLFLEHLMYHFLVPWMRKQPAETFWKTENLAFISQRLYRVVRSERLYSQKQAAQEMIKIVKQRDFTRIIQKNELQKRRITKQKRVKTKAEVFQEITANIVSYHRQLQSASEEAETADNSEFDTDEASRGGVDVDVINDGEETGAGGVNNAAYCEDHFSDLAVDRFFRRNGSLSSCEEDEDEDLATNGLRLDDLQIPEWSIDPLGGVLKSSPHRKLSSRSCGPPKNPNYEMHPFRKRSDSYFVYPRFQQKNPEPPFFNGNVIPLNGRFDFGSNSNLAPRLSGRDMRAAPRHSTKRLVRAAALDENTDNTPSLGCSGNLSSESSLADRSSSLTPANERRHSFSPPRTTESHCSGDVDHSRTPTISLPSAVNPDDVTIDSVENHPLSSAANPDANGNAASNLFANLEPLLPLNDGMVNIPIDPVILDSSSPQIPSSQSSHTLSVAPQALLPGSKQNSSGNIIPRSASTGNCVSLSKPVTPREQARSPSSVSNLQPAIDLSVVGVPSASHIPSPRSPADKRRHNSVFTVADAQNFQHNYSPRKFSDTGPHLQLDPAQLPNNSRRTQSYNKQSRDYFKRNLKLKDNRVKSTLRRHAMSGYQSQLPADFIDECTLEALSKEDLLVLWKKSEIDLESKLSEVLARNRRLSMAIDYLTSEPDKAREPEEV